MTQRNGLYDAGIIVSPSSGELILSMYCPVFDTDGKTILGYVGG
jgi:methyl-accepting chemotaxis protein